MDVAQELVPRDRKVWRRAHVPGRVLVAVLVRHDEEPYYFPDAPALLRTLHQNAKSEAGGDLAATTYISPVRCGNILSKEMDPVRPPRRGLP